MATNHDIDNTPKRITTDEKLPTGYNLLQSEYGGFYFEVGGYGSEDYKTVPEAAVAARRHERDTRKARLTQSASQLAREAQMAEGWTDATLLELLLDFCDANGHNLRLAQYLDTRKSEEV